MNKERLKNIISKSICFLHIFIFLYYGALFKLIQNVGDFSIDFIDIFICIIISLIISIVCKIFYKKANLILLIIIVITFLICTIESYLYKMFSTYFPLLNIFSMAGNVVANYNTETIILIFSNIYIILLNIIPLIIYLFFYKKIVFEPFKDKKNFVITIMSLVILILTQIILLLTLYKVSIEEHSFNGTVYKHGLANGLLFDIVTNNVETDYTIFLSNDNKSKSDNNSNLNELNIDFEKVNQKIPKNDTLRKINSYISSLNGSKKNKYTGLFKGKNLILICAESFCGYAVTKELTPTLHKLLNDGFIFKDYYNALSNISTTNGEFQFLFGLNPSYGINSMKNIVGHNNYFTMANQMKRIGYDTACFHNGDFFYYNRDISHECLGYDYFMALGNGLEKRTHNSRLDFDLFDKTLDLYVNKDKFSVYYMTYDCHLPYLTADDLYNKYGDIVKEQIGYDAQYERIDYLSKLVGFDRAVENLIKKLKDAGKLDDTVICITSDHYPYALMDAGGTVIEDLYGFKFSKKDYNLRDKNMAIIWNSKLPDQLKLDKREIEGPSSNKDLLPTLSNLFGLEFDSRFMTGRDVFSDEEPLVYWDNYCFLTKDFYYDAIKEKVIPNGNVTIDNEVLSKYKNIVNNKIGYSKDVLSLDYFNYVFDKVNDTVSENEIQEPDNQIIEPLNHKVTYDDIIILAEKVKDVKTAKSMDKTNLTIDDFETVYFGHFEQDGDLTNGSEDIEWIIVDKFDTGVLLLTKNILSSHKYASSKDGIAWKNSDLRKYLNHEFIDEIFGEDEKKILINLDHEKGQILDDQNDLENGDLIYIFSKEELASFFGIDYDALQNPLIVAKGTEAAKNNGLFTKDTKGEWYEDNAVYWLRNSFSSVPNYVSTVEYNGFLSAYGNVCHYEKNGFRPALWINWAK